MRYLSKRLSSPNNLKRYAARTRRAARAGRKIRRRRPQAVDIHFSRYYARVWWKAGREHRLHLSALPQPADNGASRQIQEGSLAWLEVHLQRTSHRRAAAVRETDLTGAGSRRVILDMPRRSAALFLTLSPLTCQVLEVIDTRLRRESARW